MEIYTGQHIQFALATEMLSEYLPGEITVAVASGARRPGEKPSLIFRQKFPAGSNTTRRQCGFTADTVRLTFSTKRQQCNNLLLHSCLMLLVHVFVEKDWVRVWVLWVCVCSVAVFVHVSNPLHISLQYLHPYKQRCVKVKWKVKKMRAAGRMCECRSDQFPLSNKAGSTFFTHPPSFILLMINISLPLSFLPSHHTFPPLLLLLLFLIHSSSLCPSFSMDEWWYSRGIVEEESFPGCIASLSQIKQGTSSDHLSSGSVMKPSHRNLCFFFLVLFSCVTLLLSYMVPVSHSFHFSPLFFKVTSMDYFSLCPVNKIKMIFPSENKHI